MDPSFSGSLTPTVSSRSRLDFSSVRGGSLERHLSKSLRAKVGDAFRFVRPENPDEVFHGVIQALSPLTVFLSPEHSAIRPLENRRRPFDLAVGLLKGEGFDDLIEPAVCLGVRILVPLLSERSQIHWGPEHFDRKRVRFESKIREASQLAGRPDRMELCPPRTLSSLLKNQSDYVIFFDEDPQALPIREVMAELSGEKPILAVTGPEGGWSERERILVREVEKMGGGCRASLGPRILPGRRAPVVVASLLSVSGHAVSQNWSPE